jgi:stearoyl-CoA desaturase (delta-9 desaturase)
MPELRAPVPSELVSSAGLQALKRRFVLGLNLVSGAGCVAAALLAARHGVSAVELSAFVAMYTLTGLGITVGYHRCFAHAAFETRPWLRTGLAVLGSMAGHGPVVSWTATHRCHHKHSDLPGDPHSPHLHGPGRGARLRGLWHAHMGWLLTGWLPNSLVFAGDLARDARLSRVNRAYPWWVAAGVALPTLATGLWTGTARGALGGLLWGGLVRLFVSFHATCAVNSLAHSFGARRFATRERSTNFALLALSTFGEGWHNNHHAFPSSARFGLRPWELDAGWLVIRLLELCGLAWNVRRPSGAIPGTSPVGGTA